MDMQMSTAVVVRVTVNGTIGMTVHMIMAMTAQPTPRRPRSVGQAKADHQGGRELTPPFFNPRQSIKRHTERHSEQPDEHRRRYMDQATRASDE
jgi:hypothetical protein